MADEQRIDIMQEVVDLYGREDMLAFFDFSIERHGQGAISGLCRISKPKQGSSQMPYLSLVFVVDTPDESSRRMIPTLIAKLEGDALRGLVPEVIEVVPMPAMGATGDNYVKQIDVLLDAHVEPDERFIAGMLLPAVRDATGLRTGELVWWDPALTAGAGGHEVAAADTPSLLEGLRRRLVKSVQGR